MKIFYFIVIFSFLAFFSCKSKSVILNEKVTNNNKELFTLLKSNDLEKIKSKINSKNANSLDSVGVSLLSRTILDKNFEKVKILVENGADPNLQNKTQTKSTPLMMCSNYDLVEIANYLIKNGADIDVQDSNGDAVINWSAYMGKYAFTKMLLKKGAKTNQKSIHSDYAIDVALKEWQDSIVTLFIDFNKGTHIVKKQNKPIIDAVKNNNINYLNDKLNNQNSNLRDEAGNTLLIIASNKGYFKLVKLLLKNNALINAINPVGHTALNKTIWSKHNKIAKFLIAQGADVNKTDERFVLPPIIAAARNNNVEMGKILLDKGANVNITNGIDNYSPIMWSVEYGHLDFIKLLLKYNPDLTIVSKYKQDVFKMTSNNKILELLKNN